ncbi:unnamed protein product [Ambrosiozyma monospora]|uniref:Unnamed protein product n=1 Tax=Ambrosiozyma monospora TaxID=43982 RepID=A0A9W6YYQ0_AMBMO|nr:unnamed protein product [Ambrosiozyma monospora]
MLAINDKVLLLKDQSTGTIRFIGYTQFRGGEWIGIELDPQFAANGKNDGSINGIRYFNCVHPNGLNGVFVRPTMLSKLSTDVSSNRTSLSSSSSSASRRLSGADVKTAKLQAIVVTLDSKVMTLKNEITQLSHQLDASQSQNSKMNEMIAVLQDNLEKEVVDKNFTADENELLKKEMENLKEKFDTLAKEANDLREELNLMHEINEEEGAETGTETHSNDILQLKARNKKLEQALVTLKEKSTNNEQTAQSRIIKLEECLEKLQCIEERYNQCEVELRSVKSANKLLKEKLDSLSDSEIIIDKLTVRNEELTTKIQALQQKVDDYEEMQLMEQDLEVSIIELENQTELEMAGLRDEVKEKAKEIDFLKRKNEKLEKVLLSLKNNRQISGNPEINNLPSNEEIERLKHENSKLLSLKTDLALQILLKKTNEISVLDYTRFVSNFSESTNLTGYFTLFKFRSLCSTLADYYKNKLTSTTVKNDEQYSAVSKSISTFYKFYKLQRLCDSMIEVYSYQQIPTDIVTKIEEFLETFEDNYKTESFNIELPNPLSQNSQLDARETTIRNLCTLDSTLRYCELLSTLIELGLKLAKVSYKVSFRELKNYINTGRSMVDGLKVY